MSRLGLGARHEWGRAADESKTSAWRTTLPRRRPAGVPREAGAGPW